MIASQGRRRFLYITTGCAALLLLISVSILTILPSQHTAKAATSFATRCGIHFCLGGKPFFYAGANSYDLFTFGDGSK